MIRLIFMYVKVLMVDFQKKKNFVVRDEAQDYNLPSPIGKSDPGYSM